MLHLSAATIGHNSGKDMQQHDPITISFNRKQTAENRWFYVAATELKATGGYSTHITEVCRVLARFRPTTLLAPTPPAKPVPHLSFHRIALPQHPPREIIFQMRVARTVGTFARAYRPRILYSRAASFNLGVLLAARMLHIPVVLEMNGIPALEYSLEHQGSSAQARALFYMLMERMEHRLASGVVVVTPQLGKYARRNGARHVHLTLNGVDPAAFIPQKRLAARQALGLPEDAEVVGYVGTFSQWQGLETLIAGARLLAPHRPQLRLYLIGDGPEKERLRTLAAPLGNQVHFAGRIHHDTVAQALSACDVLAAPFAPIKRNLRMGISALKLGEYMGIGRPILGSRLSGMEFVEEEQIGALFEPGSAVSLAQHLEYLLDLPLEQQVVIGQNARRLAETTFSWEQVVDRLTTFCEGLPH
jgi:glycosyltransferase involved in cell wall biosynthesis